MMRVEILELRTKKLPVIRKMPLCKWRLRMLPLTLNRKQIHGAGWRGVLRLPRLALSRLQRLNLSATFFSVFSE